MTVLHLRGARATCTRLHSNIVIILVVYTCMPEHANYTVNQLHHEADTTSDVNYSFNPVI